MAKVYEYGKQNRFIQYFPKYPAAWNGRLFVTGWSQEIEEPFRFASSIIVRLPLKKALVFGKWVGNQPDEETALNKAIEGRVLKDEDFEEGWTAPAYKAGEENCEYCNSRASHVDGECPLYDW